MKKVCIALMVFAVVMMVAHVTFGAETEKELIVADQQLVSLVNEAKQKELKELGLFDDGMFRQEKDKKIDELRKITHYKDLPKEQSVDEVVRMLKERQYPVNQKFLELVQDIEKYKKTHPQDDPKKIVMHFNALSSHSAESKKRISFGKRAHALSYSEWTVLTTSEKLLIAANPSKALITNSLKQLAFNFTQEKFGSNGLGNASDGYRHGVWNALMTRDISRLWAEVYATAHEDRPYSELQTKLKDGYYGYQHKAMDLANNKVGRDAILWYEYFFNCSNTTVKNRISAKLTNAVGTIIWLHS